MININSAFEIRFRNFNHEHHFISLFNREKKNAENEPRSRLPRTLLKLKRKRRKLKRLPRLKKTARKRKRSVILNRVSDNSSEL